MPALIILFILALAGGIGWLRFFTTKAFFADDHTVMIVSTGGFRWENPPLQLSEVPSGRIWLSDESVVPLEAAYDHILAQEHWLASGLIILAIIILAQGRRTG